MNRILGLTALTGFTFSLWIHISSVLGMDTSIYTPYTWTLHMGIFVVFAPLIFSLRGTVGPKPTLAQLREILPDWIIVICAILSAYVTANFLFVFFAIQKGIPMIRLFSGHWLIFYFLPFAYITFRKR